MDVEIIRKRILFRRFAATVLDFFFVMVLGGLMSVGVGLVIGFMDYDIDVVAKVSKSLGLGIGVAAQLFYYVVLQWSFEGTPGKRALGLKLKNSDGQSSVTFSQCAIRVFARILSVLPFGVGLFPVFYDSKLRCWHDQWVGTIVLHESLTAEFNKFQAPKTEPEFEEIKKAA